MKPGRWMGIIAFFFIILCLLFNYVMAVLGPTLELKIDFVIIQDITGKAIIVFSVVWGAVFGTGLAKTLKGSSNEKDSS